jgi:hypothetical protein
VLLVEKGASKLKSNILRPGRSREESKSRHDEQVRGLSTMVLLFLVVLNLVTMYGIVLMLLCTTVYYPNTAVLNLNLIITYDEVTSPISKFRILSVLNLVHVVASTITSFVIYTNVPRYRL